jgi:tRNA pseudouridine55 synthase
MSRKKKGEPVHGWLVLDKPEGVTSTQAVAICRRAFNAQKAGHGGTLDPLASGVLPIAIGEATKVAGRMLDATKQYAFTIRFGEETDTLDAEGEVVATSDVHPTAEQVTDILPQFTGPIEQIPPAYSALKIDGKAAYARARAGEEVEMNSRQVTIHEIRVISASGNEASVLTTVSKGTYIRSLARDLARALNTVGHVTMLRRTRAGPFSLEQAISLDFLTEAAKARRLIGAVLPLEAALDDIPALPITPDQAQLLRFGQRLVGFPEQPGLQLATEGGRPVALVEATADGLKVVRGFNI